MTAINQEDRKIIKTGLLKATKFKQRFQAVLVEMGKAQYEHQLATYKANDPKLMKFIDTMPEGFRKQLCREDDSKRTYFQITKWAELHPDAADFCNRMWVNSEYPRYFAAVINQQIDLKFPKSIWVPKTWSEGETTHLLTHASMTAFNNLCREFMTVELELSRLLNAIRSVAQLEKALPEAMQYLPSKSYPVAVQINAANAIAALMNAGWAQEEAVAA